MFKRSEESEWSRFSKAFTGKEEKEGEQAEDESSSEDAVNEGAAASSTPVGSPSARPSLSDTNLTVSRPIPSPTGQPIYSAEDVESIIGEHSSFDGTYRSESSVRIRGSAQGEVECAKAVFIEENAKVTAKVSAASIMVAGEVNGELNCSGRVEIRPTGRVTGTINAGVLIMQEGAYFDGNLKMSQPAGAPEPAAS